MSSAQQHQLYEVVKKFKSAMLVTRAGNGSMHARPLAVADVEHDGEIFFSTSIDSPKVAEIEADPRVLVTFQSGSQFATLSGMARVIRDRALIEDLWSETWRIWFPDGTDDPMLCILAVEPAEGEYWDNSGIKGLKYLFQGAKAYFKGKRVETDDAHAHAKVDLE